MSGGIVTSTYLCIVRHPNIHLYALDRKHSLEVDEPPGYIQHQRINFIPEERRWSCTNFCHRGAMQKSPDHRFHKGRRLS